jgi:hypothetical protein
MHLQRAAWRGKFLDNNYLVFGTDEDCAMYYDGNRLILKRNAMTSGDSSQALRIEGYPTLTTGGIRQGLLYLYMYRSTAWTSAWDGNGDIALKIQSENRSVSSASYGGIRGAEILSRNRTGSCYWVSGLYVTAENYTGSGGVTSVTGLEVHAKNNGVAAGDVKVCRLYDESQSYTGTTYALEINCTNDSAFTREYCIYINSGASSGWTNGITFDGNITNALDFADTDGTNGATYSDGYTFLDASCIGKIRVDLGGNTGYVPVYSAVT